MMAATTRPEPAWLGTMLHYLERIETCQTLDPDPAVRLEKIQWAERMEIKLERRYGRSNFPRDATERLVFLGRLAGTRDAIAGGERAEIARNHLAPRAQIPTQVYARAWLAGYTQTCQLLAGQKGD